MYLLTIIMMTVTLPLILVLAGIGRKQHPYGVILQSIMMLFLSMTLLFAFAWSAGEPLAVSIMKDVELSVDQLVRMDSFLEMTGLAGMEEGEARTALLQLYGTLVNMLPSAVVSWGILLSYLYYWVISRLRNKMGKETLLLPPFSLFTLPRKAIYGSLLIYALSWLAAAAGWVAQDTLLLNVRAMIEFVFAIQGLAVVFFTMKMKKVPGFLIVLIGGALFLSGLGRIFLSLLGFFDLLTGLRQKLQNR